MYLVVGYCDNSSSEKELALTAAWRACIVTVTRARGRQSSERTFKHFANMHPPEYEHIYDEKRNSTLIVASHENAMVCVDDTQESNDGAARRLHVHASKKGM